MNKVAADLNITGILYGLLGAVGVAGYAFVNRYVYLHYDVNIYAYSATFLIAAGLCAAISLSLNQSGLHSIKPREHLPGLVLNGVSATIAVGLVALGQRYTTVINTSIILSASTLPTIFFSWLLIKSVFDRRQFAWLSVMFVGLYVAIVGTHLLKFNNGDLIILASLIFFGFSNTYSKVLMRHNHSDIVGDVRLIVGALLVILLGVVVSGHEFIITQAGLWPLLAGFCYWFGIKAFYSSIRLMNPNKAIVLTNSHPMFTPILGVLLLSESYSWTKLIGTIVILLSLYNISKK